MGFISGVLIGLIGRPVLTLIKWFRWPFLFYGIIFNTIGTYNPQTGIATEKFTIMPFIIGIVLFSMGMTVKKYDEMAKAYYQQNNFEIGRDG